jgi:hypothetical protein
MAFYGDIDKIVELAKGSVTSDDVTDSIQNYINSWIDENIYDAGFGEAQNASEFYDIKNDDQTELILRNFPVISLTSLSDNYQSDDAVLVNSDCYVVDNDSGILQLVTAYKTISGNDVISYFTKGINSIQVIYTYGYRNVPNIIKSIANLMTARWLQIEEQQASADGLKSVSIGDYKESFDSTFINVKSRFDDSLNSMLLKAKGKFAKGY